MEYNQQRRIRSGGYQCGRAMNYGRPMVGDGGCNCENRSRETESNMVARQSGCDVCTRQMERENCPCRSCTYMRQQGCLEESADYPVGMGYVPWQSWNCVYDGHRGLMSGTIFPELDKPFCAAGRCGR